MSRPIPPRLDAVGISEARLAASARVFAAALQAPDTLMTPAERLDFADEAMRRFYSPENGWPVQTIRSEA